MLSAGSGGGLVSPKLPRFRHTDRGDGEGCGVTTDFSGLGVERVGPQKPGMPRSPWVSMPGILSPPEETRLAATPCVTGLRLFNSGVMLSVPPASKWDKTQDTRHKEREIAGSSACDSTFDLQTLHVREHCSQDIDEDP